MFIEKEMRGGIYCIAKGYSKANNKYMNDYDSSEESIDSNWYKFIVYLDANSLYGWAMSQYLSYGGFKWLSQEEIKIFALNSISENSSDGYTLEVDLEHPDELDVLHNDYPLASEKLEITYDLLSDYCKKVADKYGIKVGVVKKLVPDLGKYIVKKTKYMVHYRNLQLYLSLGTKLTKVNRVLKFKQSNWSKKTYIDKKK